MLSFKFNFGAIFVDINIFDIILNMKFVDDHLNVNLFKINSAETSRYAIYEVNTKEQKASSVILLN